MRLIDGDALSDWMKDYGQKCIKGERKISLMYVWKHIQDMQTIEERETGEWIDYIGKDLGIEGQWLRDDGKTVFIQCNQCDSLYVRNFMIHPNFCPNCGAKMSGGEQ